MTVQRVIIALFCLFLLFTASSCSTPEEKKQKHYLRALEYIKINDDKAAILELKNAVQMDAKYADARYQLGLLYLKAGNPRAAFGELQRTVSLDPENLDAGVKVAEFYLLSNKKEESRKLINQVLAIDADYVDGLSLLANLELAEGNPDKAEAAIDKALAQAPDKAQYYNTKGRILLAQSRWDEGEKLFRKAIDLDPDNFANYRTLLIFYQQRNDTQAMQKLLDTIMPKFPDNPQLHTMLANYYERQGDLAKAESELQAIVKLEPQSASSRLMLVDFYKKHQQAEKAEEALKSSLADLPEDNKLQVALADLSFDLQKFDQAQSIIDNVLQTNPNNGGANLIKARFLIKDGKNTEALQVISPLMNDYPKWAEPFYYAAFTQLQLGQMELAQQSIEQAVQNDASSDRFHALAAQIYLIRQNSIRAQEEAMFALRINSRNSTALKIYTKALVQGKDYGKAIEFIEKLNQDAVAGDVEMLGALGLAYLGQKNKAKAIETFAQLLMLAPDNSEALTYLTALTVNNDIPAAINAVKAQIDKSETAGHYLLLADLYTRNKQYEEALQAYKKVEELAPGNPRGYVLSARLLSYQGKIDETIGQFENLLKTNPDSIAGIMGLATAYEAQGKIAEAKEQYSKALSLEPNLAAAANNLAWLLASQEGSDLGEALRLAMQAKQAYPDQPHIADTLGWVHYQRKSYPLAITQFRLALDKKPDDPIIQYHLALALYGNGEKEEAIALLKKTLAKASEFGNRAEAEILLQQWKKG